MHFGFVNPNHDVPPEPKTLQVVENFQVENKVGDICPSCGAPALVYEEGCAKCHACGHSEC
jgi:ribonucleoside-diphosphate reductase alpha chain